MAGCRRWTPEQEGRFQQGGLARRTPERSRGGRAGESGRAEEGPGGRGRTGVRAEGSARLRPSPSCRRGPAPSERWWRTTGVECREGPLPGEPTSRRTSRRTSLDSRAPTERDPQRPGVVGAEGYPFCRQDKQVFIGSPNASPVLDAAPRHESPGRGPPRRAPDLESPQRPLSPRGSPPPLPPSSGPGGSRPLLRAPSDSPLGPSPARSLVLPPDPFRLDRRPLRHAHLCSLNLKAPADMPKGARQVHPGSPNGPWAPARRKRSGRSWASECKCAAAGVGGSRAEGAHGGSRGSPSRGPSSLRSGPSYPLPPPTGPSCRPSCGSVRALVAARGGGPARPWTLRGRRTRHPARGSVTRPVRHPRSALSVKGQKHWVLLRVPQDVAAAARLRKDLLDAGPRDLSLTFLLVTRKLLRAL